MAEARLWPTQKSLAEGRIILWAGESGFCLLPALSVPGRRQGRHKLSCDRLSAVSATGELSLAVQEHSCKGPDAIRFPDLLLDQAPGKLPAIRDGAPIRRSRAVKEYPAGGAARRLQPEQLTGYAPELDPDEGARCCLKQVGLRNVVCTDLAHLLREFRAAVERLLAKPDVRLHQRGRLCLVTHSPISNGG